MLKKSLSEGRWQVLAPLFLLSGMHGRKQTFSLRYEKR